MAPTLREKDYENQEKCQVVYNEPLAFTIREATPTEWSNIEPGRASSMCSIQHTDDLGRRWRAWKLGNTRSIEGRLAGQGNQFRVSLLRECSCLLSNLHETSVKRRPEWAQLKYLVLEHLASCQRKRG